MAEIKITGDVNNLKNDLARFKDNFEPLSNYEFGKLNDNIAKEYVKVFNNKMSQVAPSMAKASKRRTTNFGGIYTSTVSVPDKVYNYDKGDVRVINLNKSSLAREWVMRKWTWNKFHSWMANEKYANASRVYGSPNKPKGTLIAMSRLDKGKGSIINDTSEEMKDFARQQLKDEAPRIFNRVGQRLMGKRVYRINMQIKLGS
jgi:hypothetical protein